MERCNRFGLDFWILERYSLQIRIFRNCSERQPITALPLHFCNSEMQLGDEIKEKYLTEEILVMLEGRIRVQGLKAVLKARKESTVGTRDVLLPKVIKLLKGGPITRTEKFTPEIVTLAEWVHGKFDLEEFLEGSTNLEVKYGNNRSPYSSNLVRIESNKGLVVRVANGMFAGKVIQFLFFQKL